MTDATLGDPADYIESVPPEWSVAGHIGVSHFLLLFDHGTDAFRERLGIGRAYGEACARGLFVAEAHLTYAKEVRAGEVIGIRTRLLGAAPRKLHVFHQMRRAGDAMIAATAELLLVHVDRALGRATELPPEVLHRLQALVAHNSTKPVPPQTGRAIQFNSRS
jgi:acyl-CoA thioester hydrolase